MKKIEYQKYHSLSNSFVIINQENSKLFSTDDAEQICNVNVGIGADGIIFIEKKKNQEYNLLIQNADGSDGQFSGNGLRCAAAYIFEKESIDQASFHFPKKNSIFCKRKENQIFSTFPLSKQEDLPEPTIISINDIQCNGYFIDIGNPHFIILTSSQMKYNDYKNSLTQMLPIAPNHNISWIQILENNLIFIKTYERGVGFTQGCSSAILATLELLHHQKATSDETINIKNHGGDVEACIDEKTETIRLSAYAELICTGTYYKKLTTKA